MSYTAENEVHIHRILQASDYYKMLQISNNAIDQEIKAAHKRLVLLVHPDKNNAPKAHEAFIALNNATAVLLNRNKRLEYDEYLSSPRQFCAEKFNLSNEAVNGILIGAGIFLGSLGLRAIFLSLFGQKKQEKQENGGAK